MSIISESGFYKLIKTKSAPLPERLCEQLTCCTKNKYEQWDYIIQVTKRHNCRITGKKKATAKWSPVRTKEIKRVTNNATFAAGGQCDQCAGLLVGYSCSLALRRWRRLISPFAAVTKKPAVLSPGSLSCSISSITSCGILTVVICDFAFFAPVAISGSPKNWCMPVYAKKMIKKGLKCISPVSKLKSKGEIHLKEQRPAVLATHAGRLTTNDRKSIEVAMRNHTTHPQGRDSHNLNKAGMKNLLIATASQGYDSCAPHKTGAGITTPLMSRAIQTPHASFFVSAHTHTLTMVGCTGPTSVGLVTLDASCGNPVQSTASELTTSGGGDIPTSKEAANMATTPTLIHSQTAFIWRFIIFGASESQIIHVTAWTEREARNHCPSGCVAVFAARIRQGSHHA
ncbi:host cell division inhibitor Icd-like protein [Escherichia coli]|nr:host cell division inhibitor Icd-like protein [Escherichia coli]